MEFRRPVVLVLASTYPRWKGDHEPGFIHELSMRLGKDFEVIAIVPSSPGAKAHEFLDGVEVIRYRYAPRRFETLVNDGGIVTNLRVHRWKLFLVPTFVLGQAWLAWRLLRARRIDLIHAHWLLPQGLVAASMRGLSRRTLPYLVTSHGADLYALHGYWLNKLKRWVVRRANAVTVVSRSMKEELQALNADIDKVAVRSMGVDLIDRFTPNEPRGQDSHEILFVGRLVEKKGVRHLIDAMPMVLAAFPMATLTVVGFGPEEQALNQQVRRLDLSANIHFMGAVSQADLPPLYRRATVFVAPFVQASSGDQEGLGLVAVEALGCGCPVVITDLPATRDVMMETTACIRVSPADSAALAQAVVDVLTNSEKYRHDAIACRDQLIQRFDWNTVSREYAGILNACLHAA